MSVQHIAMVFDAGGIPSTEKHVLGAYCNHTDARGYTYAGVRRIADETGLSPATVKRARASLTKMGLIKSVSRAHIPGQKPLPSITRVNLTMLASLKRPPRRYDDDLIGIAFDSDAPVSDEPAQTGGGRAQSEPTPGGAGLNLSPGQGSDCAQGRAQSEPLIVSTTVSTTSSSSSSSSTGLNARHGSPSKEEEEPAATNTPPPAEALVAAAVSRWDTAHRRPTSREHVCLTKRVAAALADGATEKGIVHGLTRDLAPAQVRSSAVQVVMSRTKDPDWAVDPDPTPAKPVYRARCDDERHDPDAPQSDRFLYADDVMIGLCPCAEPITANR